MNYSTEESQSWLRVSIGLSLSHVRRWDRIDRWNQKLSTSEMVGAICLVQGSPITIALYW